MNKPTANLKWSTGLCRRFLGRPVRLLHECMWNHGLSHFEHLRPVHAYGAFLHSVILKHAVRQDKFATYFLRNRPQLEMIRRCADKKPERAVLKVAVLGCSKGAEAYSVQWIIRSGRPDLHVLMHAVDISENLLRFGERGVYLHTLSEDSEFSIFERITEDEMAQMFVREGNYATIQSWLREGITWLVGDAGDPGLVMELGPHDIVVANNFLCHMSPSNAEKCLRNLAELVAPGGCLFISGVDLDVRTKVAQEAGWEPILDLLEDIHYGDQSQLAGWPCKYWSLEPLDKGRDDWQIRYAAAFRVGRISV